MNWWIYPLIAWTWILPLSIALIYNENGYNRARKKVDKWADEHVRGYFVAGTLLFVAVAVTLAPTIQAIGNHMTAVTCSNWGRANDRLSRFVVYTFWNTDCITPSGNGHWISTSSLIANNVTVNK